MYQQFHGILYSLLTEAGLHLFFLLLFPYELKELCSSWIGFICTCICSFGLLLFVKMNTVETYNFKISHVIPAISFMIRLFAHIFVLFKLLRRIRWRRSANYCLTFYLNIRLESMWFLCHMTILICLSTVADLLMGKLGQVPRLLFAATCLITAGC